MTAELQRVVRALRERGVRSVTLAWFLDRTGDWLALITLLTGAAEIGFGEPGASVIAWTLTAWIAPRQVLGVLYASVGERLGLRAWPALLLAKALLIAIAVGLIVTPLLPGRLEWLLGTAAILGFVSALTGDVRAATLRRSISIDRLGQASVATSFADRAALLVGGVVAGAISYFVPIAVAFAVAIVVFALAALTIYRVAPRPDGRTAVATDEPDPRDSARQVIVWLAAAFTGGAVAAAFLVASFTFFNEATDESVGAFLVAAAGLGMLFGPLPLPRLLLRLPAAALLLGLTLLIAGVAVAVLLARSFPVALLALVVFGLASVTVDRLRSIALRRVAPPALSPRLTRLSLLAITAGQLFGAIGIVSTSAGDAFAVVVVLVMAQLLLLLLGVARGGRGALRVGSLSPLPVKSVVHKLSWDTRPAARAPDLHDAGIRAQRLARWINRTVTMEQLSATLPISGREYAVFRPDEVSRERLFEQGRADPDKQMPYWAKVWPSGVALADVVVERREEVAGRQILELGAGLGVTASAVLEYGGDLVTADYSALPLAHCRLTTLVNTGRAPEATCFNWRRDAEIAAVLAQPRFAGGFPLIIGGDLLYEGRDAEPLLNVIERMLTPDGQLWLAEPVRRTAQRFLDSAVEHGWEIESRQVRAAWPDATDGPVNLHFLRRSSEPDHMAYDLGGWRT